MEILFVFCLSLAFTSHNYIDSMSFFVRDGQACSQHTIALCAPVYGSANGYVYCTHTLTFQHLFAGAQMCDLCTQCVCACVRVWLWLCVNESKLCDCEDRCDISPFCLPSTLDQSGRVCVDISNVSFSIVSNSPIWQKTRARARHIWNDCFCGTIFFPVCIFLL